MSGATGTALPPTLSPRPPVPPPRRRRVHQVVPWVASALAGVILVASAAGWGVLTASGGRLPRIPPFAGPAGERGPAAADAATYLVLGSDAREDLTPDGRAALGIATEAEAPGRRSDTMLLVHISKARDSVAIVSLPRDSYAEIPSYLDATGTQQPASRNRLNAAYALGGPQLAVQAVEQATGMDIDHYVEVDFTGFATMIDAMGGVEVCTLAPIHDGRSGLVMGAGTTRLNGIRGLQYARARDFDGSGDSGRIRRQQVLLSAMLRQSMNNGMLVSPAKLTKYADAVLESVQTDPGLERGGLLRMATALRRISPEQVTFVTVPLTDESHVVPGIGTTVLWDDGAMRQLFENLRLGKPIRPANATRPASGVTVPPGKVRVRVFNGTSQKGLAATVSADFGRAGFTVVDPPQNADRVVGVKTVIRYDPRWREQLKTLQAALPGAQPQSVPGLGGTFEVVAGTSYTGLIPVNVPVPVTTAANRTGDSPSGGTRPPGPAAGSAAEPVSMVTAHTAAEGTCS